MKLASLTLLFSLMVSQTFAASIEGNIVCKVSAERSAECFHADEKGNINYDRMIENGGLELAMALLEAGGQDEHGMGSTYISANDVVCADDGVSLKCQIAE
ncbi:MAG: hypothetical protein VXV96_14365 [Bdellovibrionota bacterium]|nr:hypothetical protein [Bdellovibrionota bacterium]